MELQQREQWKEHMKMTYVCACSNLYIVNQYVRAITEKYLKNILLSANRIWLVGR